MKAAIQDRFPGCILGADKRHTMKKFEFRTEYKLPGTNKKVPYVYSKWKFTDEEKEEIRRVLKNETSNENIDEFINPVEELCVVKMMRLREESPKSEIRDTRERILIDCKTALKHLERISKLQVLTWEYDTLDYYGLEGECDKVSDFIVQEFSISRAAIGPLEKFIEFFEKHHLADVSRIGRKYADSDHFIRRIRSLYIKYIGKPTTYEKGAFFSVVQVILEILGLPCNDPSRVIKAALKNK